LKTYSLEDINKKFNLKNTNQDLQENEGLDSISRKYYDEEFDKAKTRILKYVLYKKRTEKEVIDKFKATYSDELVREVIDNLKDLGYINDQVYIDKTVKEFMKLKNLSRFELKYKLIKKGITKEDIEEYFDKHRDELLEYEKRSAENLYNKKKKSMDVPEIKKFLYKKGYKEEAYSKLCKTY